MKAQKVTAHRTLEGLVTEERFASQIELVRQHWAAVRRLWFDGNDTARIRSDLSDDFLLGCGMPGIASIKPTVDVRFEFVEDGLTAVIIPCYDTIPGMLDANPEAHVEHLVDLVAVNLDHPDRCWRRRGEALVLGAAYLDIADQEGEPVPVFRNAMTWLRSGGAGIVVLDWDWVPGLLLGFDLIAEDVDLGNRLEAALRPDIWVKEAAA